jgi:hypothetical protein
MNKISYTSFSFPGTSGGHTLTSTFKEENGPHIKFYMLLKLTWISTFLPRKIKTTITTNLSASQCFIFSTTRMPLPIPTPTQISIPTRINIHWLNINHLILLLLCLTWFAGLWMTPRIGTACCLNLQEFFAMWMLLLIQIMASLIREALVWVYLLSICRFIQQITYTSGLHYKRHIVSSFLRQLP